MSTQIKFDIKDIQHYVAQRSEKGNECIDNFNVKAIFSIFDKNYDGQISKEEFYNITKEQYEQYVSELENYNAKNNQKKLDIWSYQKLENYLNNKFKDENNAIIEEELLAPDTNILNDTKIMKSFNGSSVHADTQDIDLSGTHNLSETFTLKDISQMTENEIREELSQYNIKSDNLNLTQLQRILQKARNERAKSDIGSDKVDGRIGTFIQQEGSRYCSILAKIETMNPEEIATMYDKEPKIDPKTGEKYWEIRFPIDDGTDTVQIITESEIKSGKITVDGITLSDFPQGDLDVTLIVMAFVKRFGPIPEKGAWAFQTSNKFRKPSEPAYLDNQYLESLDFNNLPAHSIVNILEPDELDKKGLKTESRTEEELSWLPDGNKVFARMSRSYIYEMSDGRKACISGKGIFLSDGTKIVAGHALSVRGFDNETQEVIVSCNEFGNLSETRIPVELMQFFETASMSDVEGTKRTPQPE